MDLKNKKVTVVGLGNSGLAAAILLNSIGADTYATDSHDTPVIRDSRNLLENRGVRVEIGKHTEDFIKGSKLVVVSPGVGDDSPAIRWANALPVPIISEMELGYRFCKGKIIGITGTNGKSTVTTLIGEILKSGGKDTVVCGNIGNSLCGEIPRIKKGTWVVLEVSSFQLERIEKFKAHIAVILNITDDHMDRYKNFEEYFTEKLKIFRNQDKDDVLILNYDAENLRRLKDRARSRTLFYSRLKATNGAYIKGTDIFCLTDGSEEKVLSTRDIALKGLYNVENILASALVGRLARVNPESIRDAIRNFKGLSHRFETVDIIDGVEYIDDSKGTTVDSTIRALESCSKDVVLIAGGKDKFSNYSLARDMIEKKVRHLVLIGEASGAIKKAVGDLVDTRQVSDMLEAVSMAKGLAKSGWAVLLSPMCSSFDMFTSYRERGEVFKREVRSIKESYAKVNPHTKDFGMGVKR